MQSLIANHFDVIYKASLALIIMLGGVGVAWSRLCKRAGRVEQLRAFAVRRDWLFDHEPKSYDEFICPKPCRRRQKLDSNPENIIYGEISELEIVVFDDLLIRHDYQGVANPEQQTTIALRMNGYQVASFTIKPKSQQLRGDQPDKLDLSRWSSLDKLFVVTSSDPAKVDPLFTEGLVSLLVTQPQHTVQFEAGWVLFSAEGCMSKPSEIDRMIDRLLEIAELFTTPPVAGQVQAA